MTRYSLREFWSRSSSDNYDEEDFIDVADSMMCSPRGPWLGGGAVRRFISGLEQSSDFDFFFRDETQLNQTAGYLESIGLVKIKETEHHLHYQGPIGQSKLPRDIQLIRFKYYGSAEEVADSFDYTICQFIFDGHDLITGEHSLWDLGRKKLVLHKLTYPVSTMRRLLKYTKQGYTACAGCLASILQATHDNPALMQELSIQYVD